MTPRDITAELEQLRFSEPLNALELAVQRAETADRETLPLYLGEWAAALRAMGKTTDARAVAMAALLAAKQWGTPPVIGDVLQKLAYVEAYRGRVGIAWDLAGKAMAFHTEGLYLGGVGRCLGDRGYFCILRSDYERGIQLFDAALEYIEPDDHLARFSCSINACLCIQRSGLDVGRRKYLDIALKDCGDNIPTGMLMRARWERAELDAKGGKDDEACGAFEELATYFLEVEQIPQAALASCELIQSLLRQGLLDEALEVATNLAPLVMDLADDSATAAAIAQIVRCAGTTRDDLECAVRAAASMIRKSLA